MSLENLCTYWRMCREGDREECREDYEICPIFQEYLERELNRKVYKDTQS
tara:strand:- start:822 stop:971 length:150 start_codon:yes stop_codon:yes gene_type:complete